MNWTRHAFWIVANLYGRLLGRAWLAPLHHANLLLSLHALGYDNGWRDSFTGERWFVRNVLRPARVRIALDIGANVGAYSQMLRDELACDVYAFEPSAAAFDVLIERADSHVHAFQTAVADREGTATLYAKHPASPRASLDPDIGGTGAEAVSVTTIDAFCTQEKVSAIDFVKIDTEGYEHEVLVGMQETLKRLRPRYVQFEFNIMHLRRGHTLLGLSLHLPGYTFYRLLPHGWLKIEPEQFLSNIFMFSNIIAVREADDPAD